MHGFTGRAVLMFKDAIDGHVRPAEVTSHGGQVNGHNLREAAKRAFGIATPPIIMWNGDHVTNAMSIPLRELHMAPSIQVLVPH